MSTRRELVGFGGETACLPPKVLGSHLAQGSGLRAGEIYDQGHPLTRGLPTGALPREGYTLGNLPTGRTYPREPPPPMGRSPAPPHPQPKRTSRMRGVPL